VAQKWNMEFLLMVSAAKLISWSTAEVDVNMCCTFITWLILTTPIRAILYVLPASLPLLPPRYRSENGWVVEF
jgi:hypothetical protein